MVVGWGTGRAVRTYSTAQGSYRTLRWEDYLCVCTMPVDGFAQSGITGSTEAIRASSRWVVVVPSHCHFLITATWHERTHCTGTVVGGYMRRQPSFPGRNVNFSGRWKLHCGVLYICAVLCVLSRVLNSAVQSEMLSAIQQSTASTAQRHEPSMGLSRGSLRKMTSRRQKFPLGQACTIHTLLKY